VEEAAELIGISRAKAYECVRSGELKGVQLGRRVVIPRIALEQLLGLFASQLDASLSGEAPGNSRTNAKS
jgi:excisionase family DNA binding protein